MRWKVDQLVKNEVDTVETLSATKLLAGLQVIDLIDLLMKLIDNQWMDSRLFKIQPSNDGLVIDLLNEC